VFEQVQHQRHEPVAVVSSQAAADLLVATLQVNGITASTAMASVYPSLDWVDGLTVAVAVSDVARATELVRALGHDPLPRPAEPDGPTGPG
jgi:hypothetical protein